MKNLKDGELINVVNSVDIVVTPQVLICLKALASRGVYGNTPNGVASHLLREAIARELIDGLLSSMNFEPGEPGYEQTGVSAGDGYV